MGALTGARDLIIDAWSALSHKAPLRDDQEARINGWTPKTWIGEEHRRRITAYQVLAAYDANVSREFLATTDDDDRAERREYGDPGLIIDTILASLLGEEQEIVVPGAEDYDPALDETPTEGDGDAEEPDPDALAANDAARALAARQDWLRDWAQKVHLELRLVDSERNDVKYGDSALLLGWSDAQKRVVPAVMDPGFYFPVLPDSLDSYEYPTRVHFAWEIPGEDFPDNKVRVRRITYDLRPLAPWYDDDSDTDMAQEAAEHLPAGATWVTGPNGHSHLVRTYPWSDEPSKLACYLTDATWVLDDLDKVDDVDGFTIATAETVREDEDGNPLWEYDLEIDFLPVVHVPNTPPGGDHYGQSSLARVLQLIDDLQNADTDAQAAAATTGSPIIGISGSATGGADPLTGTVGQTMEVRPGAAWRLGENGGLTTINTSANLAATREYVQSLRDRLLVNSRLPAAIVGTVKPSEVPSGYAMQLSFGPLTAMIRQMRLVRAVKYPLMLKMVQKLAMANGELPPGPPMRAEVSLGAFLPSDQAAVLERVAKAYEKKLISLETAVTELLEAGFAIDDVAEEITRIQERDYQSANDLADATGDQDAVRAFLGLDPVTEQAGVPRVQLQLPIAGGRGVGEPNRTDSGRPTT